MMQPPTSIREMMAGKKIVVPSYQRAYSWDTALDEKTYKNNQTNIFLSDLDEYREGNAKSSYYFGHFIFEKKNQTYYVIDGQQRLTTIVMFLSALFAKLKDIRDLSQDEEVCYKEMIKDSSAIRFSTVDYNNDLFETYVIEQTYDCQDVAGLDTESARRIVKAFDFFKHKVADKSEKYLEKMCSIISTSTCTTHEVQNELEAIQMFIFQNNRGKRPSNLEIIKAQFMHHVHLHGNNDKDKLTDTINERFEIIYKSISSIEYRIDEDDILLYTLKVYFNSLWETNPLTKINNELSKENSLDFIKSLTLTLKRSFEHLSRFFVEDERKHFEIHSLITLGGISTALPFIIKAYEYSLPPDNQKKLCSSLESLVLRHRLIGTRADMTSRLNDVFQQFTKTNKDITPIIDRIESMKKRSEWWWAYWNNDAFKKSIQGKINNHSVAKYLLWKYEIHLEKQGKAGYLPTRFDRIENPELEHIAPTKEPEKKPHGYDNYDDDEFTNQSINCLGNYLLISKSHNCSVGNAPFAEKRETYTHLEQQREIQELVPENGEWNKEIIQKRKDKIIGFMMANF